MNPTLLLPGDPGGYLPPFREYHLPTHSLPSTASEAEGSRWEKIGSFLLCSACASASALLVAWLFWWGLCLTLSAPVR